MASTSRSYKTDYITAYRNRHRQQLWERSPVLAQLTDHRDGLLGFSLYVSLFTLLFCAVCVVEPVNTLSASRAGVQDWVEQYVHFERLSDGKHGDDGKLDNVESLDDVVLFQRSLIIDLLKQKDYAGDLPDGVKQRPHLLLVNQVVNSLLIVQSRTGPAPGCDHNSTAIGCTKLSREDEDAMWGHDATQRTYTAELPLAKLENTLALYEELMARRWWDSSTRTSVFFFAFHNELGDFTGICEVRFWMCPFGSVNEEVFTSFLQLATPTKGLWVLVLVIVVTSSCMILLVARVLSRPHLRWSVAEVLRAWNLVELLGYLFIIWSVVGYIVYMTNPVRGQIDLASNEYQHLMRLAQQWKHVFTNSGLALLLLTCRLIEFLSCVAKPLEFYTRVIARAFEQAAWFLILFFVVFIGFSMSANVLFGEQIAEFSSLESSLQTTAKWWVTLTEPPRAMFRQTGGGVYFSLFVAIVMILLFNMFVMIVISAADAVKREDADGVCSQPRSLQAANCLCDGFGVSKFDDDPYELCDDKSQTTPLVPSAGI